MGKLGTVADIHGYLCVATGYRIAELHQPLHDFMLKRTHEYGIRRVFGAGRGAVFAQIFAENFLLSALAVLLAWVCIELTRVPVSRFSGLIFLIQLSMGICPWRYLYSFRW